jgi:hypothetical protein
MVLANRPVTRQEPIEQTIARLEVYIGRYERRYECTSEDMLKAVRDRRARETADISSWLTNYLTLLKLRAIRGVTDGSPTPNT